MWVATAKKERLVPDNQKISLSLFVFMEIGDNKSQIESLNL
jgi:hypothetical protein